MLFVIFTYLEIVVNVLSLYKTPNKNMSVCLSVRSYSRCIETERKKRTSWYHLEISNNNLLFVMFTYLEIAVNVLSLYKTPNKNMSVCLSAVTPGVFKQSG